MIFLVTVKLRVSGKTGIPACAGKRVTGGKHIVYPQARMPALLSLTVTYKSVLRAIFTVFSVICQIVNMLS